MILARLISVVKETLSKIFNITETTCWTDSSTVLHWVNGKKDYKQFVQNRIDEILRLTDSETWRFCPGLENPADIGSRGQKASELAQNDLWWKGPQWLTLDLSAYPDREFAQSDVELTEECMKECRIKLPTKGNTTVVNVANVSETHPPETVGSTKLSEIIDHKSYSSVTKLFRVTAWVKRFIRNLKTKKACGKIDPLLKPSTLTVEEINDAEKIWIREIQEHVKKQKNYQDLTNQLGLYADKDHIIRCKGRMENASSNVETRSPILLPRDHSITQLIVESCHKKVKHGGIKETLTELRSKYWIPKGRQLVRYILNRCVKCRKVHSVAFKPVKQASLPEHRVKETAAFTHVGVDFAGPLFVKTSDPQKQMKKAYICLFTCSTSRALHLELVHDLSTIAFIRCLRRFIARRGTPVSITSDNAKTFKKADKELAELFKGTKLEELLTTVRIKWNFILERAPWWGGYYERMVQLVKRSLRKILGNARLTFEELTTVLTEVEGSLNSRPLTYVYSELSDGEPLTPSHLVIGRRVSTLPDPEEFSDSEEDSNAIVRRQRYLSQLLQHFWKRWNKEYLADLREFHRNTTYTNNTVREVEVGGEVVLVQGEDLPRSQWKIGRVEALLKSKDGEVRGVKLRALNKKGKPIVLRRPIQKLVPLEIKEERKNEDSKDPKDDADIQNEVKPTRQRRIAAINADLKRQSMIDQL